MASPEILARLDAAIAELQAIRAELQIGHSSAGVEISTSSPDGQSLATSLADEWISVGEAAHRFGIDKGTVRLWARQGLGRKTGGRWRVSVRALRDRLGQ